MAYCAPCNKRLVSQTSLESHKRTKTHKHKIKNCPFLVDGAKTSVHPSLLLKDFVSKQTSTTNKECKSDVTTPSIMPMGLFADEDIRKDTIITWYVGVNCPTLQDVEERVNHHGKSMEFVMDVSDFDDKTETRLAPDYYIDGWIMSTDTKRDVTSSTSTSTSSSAVSASASASSSSSKLADATSGHVVTRSLATYINHSTTHDNVEYRYMIRPEAYKSKAVAIVAKRKIKKGEELLVNYGEKYHQYLLEAGMLVTSK